jgi:hypothetical protein
MRVSPEGPAIFAEQPNLLLIGHQGKAAAGRAGMPSWPRSERPPADDAEILVQRQQNISRLGGERRPGTVIGQYHADLVERQ